MNIIDKYELNFENTNIPILIYSKPQEFVNTYEVGILETGKYTQIIIEKIKEDLLREGIFENRKAENLYLKKGYVLTGKTIDNQNEMEKLF